MVVVSLDHDFLGAFAEWSLKGRLLVWTTKLVVVTRLNIPQLQILLPAHWTFSMMNTVFLNIEGTSEQTRRCVMYAYRCGMYTYLPYSVNGSQIVKIAFWTPARGFKHLSSASYFQEKFEKFVHPFDMNLDGNTGNGRSSQGTIGDGPQPPGREDINNNPPTRRNTSHAPHLTIVFANQIYNNLVAALGLTNHVTFHTHKRGGLLDPVLSDLPEERISCHQLGKVESSDHHAVLTKIQLHVARERAAPRTIWLWEQARWQDMRDELAATDWQATLAGNAEKARAVISHLVDL
ncbi:hypothetical protein E2C01_045241 [Portunus trituberculatus]|uniref:Endonuclease/exonuclease/phosphatase domain-containing protein n=1 Tax=Portunus trituberculatus TaxID=210409 RepID=A0A5B7G1H2_PORTR|nr:hypothetical protein [Portunus trituberculatus]